MSRCYYCNHDPAADDFSGLSEADAALLKSLEDEGVMSGGIAGKVRSALRVANAAGRIRFRLTVAVSLLAFGACLTSGSVAAPFVWLQVLLGLFAAIAALTGVGFFIASGVGS